MSGSLSAGTCNMNTPNLMIAIPETAGTITGICSRPLAVGMLFKCQAEPIRVDDG